MLFSVGIPTLQRASQLVELLDLYCMSDVVGEVLVVNNSQQPILFSHDKLRVFQQQENIYVNPAWNLIAEHARFPYLVLSNDDIIFDPSLLPAVRSFMRRHRVGIVGPHRSVFTRTSSKKLRFTPLYGRSHGFGTLMFLRRDNFAPIPPQLKIGYGDDWLFASQHHRNWSFRGCHIETPMSVTSASAEFTARIEADAVAFKRIGAPISFDRRFGREARIHRRMARVRDALIPR